MWSDGNQSVVKLYGSANGDSMSRIKDLHDGDES